MTRTLIFAMILLSGQALAAEPTKVRGTYWIDFAGIPVGKLWVQVLSDGQICTSHTKLKTSGVVRMFEKLTTTSKGIAQWDNGWLPRAYSRQKEDDEPDYSKLTYDEKGNITSREVVPEDDPNWRPLVPAEEVSGVWHPAVALCGIAQSMREQQMGQQQSYPIYDGKRYLNLLITRDTADTFSIKREPISGYTPKELAAMEEGDPPLYATVRNGSALPNHILLELPFGKVTARFEADPSFVAAAN